MLQNVISTWCKLLFLEKLNISEYLKLPKSTLQCQLAHGAKTDMESDFKFETEYLLACSIPNKPPNEAIFLEDCLFDYFTNIVQVKRQLSAPGNFKPSPNYDTKPSVSPFLATSNPSSSNSTPPPPYTESRNGFYGSNEKAAASKKSIYGGESNVPAWQVTPCYDLLNCSSSSSCLIILLRQMTQK